METKDRMSTSFLFLLLIGTSIVTFFLFKQFFITIMMAGVFASVLFPLHARLRRLFKNRNVLSALTICLLVIVLIVIPFVAIVSMLTVEAVNTYQSIEEKILSGYFDDLFTPEGEGWIAEVIRYVSSQITNLNTNFSITVNWEEQLLSLAQISSQWIVDSGTALIKNIFITLFYFVIFMFTLFFFLLDGEKFMKEIKYLSPLRDSQDEIIYRKFKDVSGAAIFGTLAIAIIQGVLGGLGFLFLGLPSPLLWGTVMTFGALIPMVGTPIVWVPAVIILLLTGAWVKAIILAVYCLLIVSTADNFLRPILLEGKSKLHPLILFFSILGGLTIFGPLGIILGPIVIALFVTILHLYRTEFKDYLSSQSNK